MFKEHKIEAEADALLRENDNRPPNPECIKNKDILENIRKQLMLVIEKCCRKQGMGDINFLPVKNLWLKWYQTWNEMIRRFKRKIIDKTLIL